ncbi:MAG: sensor histidine kinase [Actinomycetota bacterium]|nr:sensor histidine kinase [Actinomycetota bacterium]
MSTRNPARRLGLSGQVLLLQLAVVIVVLGIVAGAAFLHARTTLNEQYGQRALIVARTVATLPATRAALASGTPGGELQQLVEQIRKETDMTYIAVADTNGIRYTHPNTQRIGQQLSTDWSDVVAGATVISTETGTLGRTVRAKVPVRDSAGTIVGLVSVGVLAETVNEESLEALWTVLGYGGASLLLGVAGTGIVARLLRRKTLGLRPDEITALFEHREATLLSIREGVVTLDRNSRITLLNGEAKRLLDLDDEAIGSTLVSVVDSAHVAEFIGDSLGGPETVIVVAGRVLVVSHREVSVSGQAIGSVITLRDRTELEELVRELATVSGMADALRAKAHEYSNRLHTIAALIELGHYDDAINLVASETRIAQALSDAINDDVGDPLLNALLLAKTSQANERGIRLLVQADRDLVGAGLLAPNDVVAVVGNLVDNAIDAVCIVSDPTIHVSLHAEGDTLVVAVDDNGPGVPADAVDQIFGLGFTTKVESNDRTLGRRGIGLALVADAVARHNGDITVAVSEHHGARFTARLHGVVPVPAGVGA